MQTFRQNEYDRSMVLLSFILLVLSLYFYRGIPDSFQAILMQLSTDSADYRALEVSNLRFEQTKGAYFGVEARGQGFFSLIMRLGWPIVIAYFLIRYRHSPTPKLLALSLCVFSLGFIFILSLGSRGPTLIFLMMLLASYSVFKAIRIKTLFYSASSIVFLAIMIGSFSTKMNYIWLEPGIESLQRAATEIAERIFIGNVINDIRVIDLVNQGSWELSLGNANLRNIISALPGIQYGLPLAHELFLEFNPGSTATTFYSGTYLSIVFADFAIWGVLAIYPVIGFIIGMLQRRYFAITTVNPFLLAAMSGPLFYSFMSVLVSGISGIAAQTFVYLMLLCIIFIFKIVFRPRLSKSNFASG